MQAVFVMELMYIQARPKFTTRYANTIATNVNMNKRRYLRLCDSESLLVTMKKMVAFERYQNRRQDGALLLSKRLIPASSAI